MKNARLLMVAVILLSLITLTSAGWEDEIPVEVPRPLESYLQPVPFETIIVYGNSEKTRVIFNLINQQTDIEQLKKQNNGLQTAVDEGRKEATAFKAEVEELRKLADEQKKAIVEVAVDKTALEDKCLKFELQIASLENEVAVLKEAIIAITVDKTAEKAGIVDKSAEKGTQSNGVTRDENHDWQKDCLIPLTEKCSLKTKCDKHTLEAAIIVGEPGKDNVDLEAVKAESNEVNNLDFKPLKPHKATPDLACVFEGCLIHIPQRIRLNKLFKPVELSELNDPNI